MIGTCFMQMIQKCNKTMKNNTARETNVILLSMVCYIVVHHCHNAFFWYSVLTKYLVGMAYISLMECNCSERQLEQDARKSATTLVAKPTATNQ